MSDFEYLCWHFSLVKLLKYEIQKKDILALVLRQSNCDGYKWFICVTYDIKNAGQLFMFSLEDVNVLAEPKQQQWKIRAEVSIVQTGFLVNLLELFCEPWCCKKKQPGISLLCDQLHININTQSLCACGCWRSSLWTNMQLIVSIHVQTEVCTLEWWFRVCVCLSGYQSRLEWHHFPCLSYVCCFWTFSWTMEVLYV